MLVRYCVVVNYFHTIMHRNHLVLIISLFSLLALAGCTTNSHKTNVDDVYQRAAYAVPDKYAALEVERVLSSGGNAVDAAIVAAFVLAVTFPEAGNIGGGGFMLLHQNGEQHFLDYREKAPLAAERNMFLDSEGSVVEKASLVGMRAAGVPGTVAGMYEAHQRFATRPWAELLAPAIRYAKDGFEVHPKKAQGIPEIVDWFEGEVNFEQHFGAMANGGLFKQPQLAKTLERIAIHGPTDFYQGTTAKLLLKQSEKDNGLFAPEDLRSYRAVWRSPLKSDWRRFEIVSAPPPSSGGFAVIQLLKMKELLDDEFVALEPNSAQYIHLIAEIEKRVFADRAEYLGDPDFTDVPIQQLISDEYILRRSKEVNTNTISVGENVVPGLESPSTTHFSIVDKWGNAVANTYTINWNYGNGVVVEGAGFLMNNQMDDFSTKPGVANIYGVVGGVANEIQPTKRMLSSMSPTLLLKDNKVQMVLGTPGGSTIFTSVFQTIVNVIDNGMSAQEAVSASRFHHQLIPNDLITTSISIPLEEAVVRELQERGYRIEPHGWEFGDVQLIDYRDGELDTASDPRGIGVSGAVE